MPKDVDYPPPFGWGSERTAVSIGRVVDGAWRTSGFGVKRGGEETAEE